MRGQAHRGRFVGLLLACGVVGSTLFFGAMSPSEVLEALGADLIARGHLHPSQVTSARALVEAGRLPSTALIDVGAPADHVVTALATVTGLPQAPPRARWMLEARLPLSTPMSTWQALIAVPIGTTAGRPLIAFADPSRLGVSLAMSLPAHTACVALENDIRDALAVTPAPKRVAVSFLAPPSAVSVQASSSSAFNESTRPALGATQAGVLPPLTDQGPALSPSPFASPSFAPPVGAAVVAPVIAAPVPAVTAVGGGTLGFGQATSPFSSPDPAFGGVGTTVGPGVGIGVPVGAGASAGTSVGVGSQCGSFVLERRIGEGGMASVFLGVAGPAGQGGQRSAIKVIHEHLLRSSSGDDLRRRFQREAQAMRPLHHKNIVELIEAGHVSGTEYLATEFVPGGALNELTRDVRKLPPLVAVLVFADILEGLAHAHAHNVIHRDLKPENLLLDSAHPDVPVKIADFGIARLAEGTKLTGTNNIIGTPAYMSPEQAMAAPMDGRTDLYTAGVILYELITGRNPFVGDSPMVTLSNVITGAVRPLGDVEPSVPMLLDQVVARLLSLRADDRFATATDVLDAIAPVLARAREKRALWAAVARRVPGAVDRAFASEAAALSTSARAELANPDRAACAALLAFRATSLNPDFEDARGVLSALEARGQRFHFTRSNKPGMQTAERATDTMPMHERQAACRSIGDAYFADGNPRYASQWWRRATREFGIQKEDLERLARVTLPAELQEAQHLDKSTLDHPSRSTTVAGRAWKAKSPASQQATIMGPGLQAPASTAMATPPETRSVPVAAIAAVVLAVVLVVVLVAWWSTGTAA